MKKILIVVAVTACAMFASAATCKWNSGVIKLSDGATTATKNAVTGYVWEFATSTIYDQVVAGTLDVVAEFQKENHGALGASPLSKGSTSTGKVNINGTLDVASPNQVYAVILYVEGDNKAFLYNYAKSGDVGTTGITVDEISNYRGGSILSAPQGEAISGGWAAAPEPTSGLLLLLGVAGLALKRKRA